MTLLAMLIFMMGNVSAVGIIVKNYTTRSKEITVLIQKGNHWVWKKYGSVPGGHNEYETKFKMVGIKPVFYKEKVFKPGVKTVDILKKVAGIQVGKKNLWQSGKPSRLFDTIRVDYKG